MKCYADSSFIGQLLVPDFASVAALASYRSLNRPPLIYSGLHRVEVPNLLRLRIFAAANAAARTSARREAEMGRRRLQHMLESGRMLPAQCDWDAAVGEANDLSAEHCEELGVRALDLLHVALARVLHADYFLTCDRRQAKLAKRAGLNAEFVEATS